MLDHYDVGPPRSATVLTRSRRPVGALAIRKRSNDSRSSALPNAEESLGIEVRQWDNWYDYPGTHWDRRTVTGLDRGESSPLVYALHCLVGHHGLFSLTPLWLLSIVGCWLWHSRPGHPHGGSAPREGSVSRSETTTMDRTLALTTALITLIVLAFYLSRPIHDRNYGGGTCCLRWLVWLTPLWLLDATSGGRLAGQVAHRPRGRARLACRQRLLGPLRGR